MLPSVGIAGGILIGVKENKFVILNSWILTYSITILIKNKNLGFIWMFTSIYGPIIPSQRNNFWNELNDIRKFSDVVWLIGEDFNVVRNRSEIKGHTFNHVVSAKFNNFINSN
jgi:hypothetical protein